MAVVFESVGKIIKLGLMEIPSDGLFSQLMGAEVQKRACGLRCRLLPGIFMVESAENRTGDDLQFPLWGYADRAASYGIAVALRRERMS